LHVDDIFARARGFQGRVAYGNLLGLMLSRLVGVALNAPDVMIISEKLDFTQPVFVSDTVELRAVVDSSSDAVRVVDFKLEAVNQKGVRVARGRLQVKFIGSVTNA
jgi:acyl dehydratase